MSTGTSSLCARFHSRLSTLWAITPSLSSSAKRRMSSSSFSRCFLLALVQLACTRGREARVYLCRPDVVQVLHCKSFFFDNEAEDLFQFLYVLRLVQTVPQHNGQDVVLLDPLLARDKRRVLDTSQKGRIERTAMRSAVSHSSSSGLCR
ncbi:hypothetical protein EYF80_036678 [Liparis tanakae]|uniref:Uncharacterized protein n=1 Tax=Liparis tanakae TaxID=230148 RepID=A0A4Z2GI26_9TELE|nr:hypothetical protein EYF80_036678 [Liparis tanakae]